MSTQEYMRKYMKEYIAESETIHCEKCGGHYKAYRKYKHLASKKHRAGNANNTMKEMEERKFFLNLEHLMLIEILLRESHLKKCDVLFD